MPWREAFTCYRPLTAKRLRNRAQRCRPAATLGTVTLKEFATPSGLSLIEMPYPG